MQMCCLAFILFVTEYRMKGQCLTFSYKSVVKYVNS